MQATLDFGEIQLHKWPTGPVAGSGGESVTSKSSLVLNENGCQMGKEGLEKQNERSASNCETIMKAYPVQSMLMAYGQTSSVGN